MRPEAKAKVSRHTYIILCPLFEQCWSKVIWTGEVKGSNQTLNSKFLHKLSTLSRNTQTRKLLRDVFFIATPCQLVYNEHLPYTVRDDGAEFEKMMSLMLIPMSASWTQLKRLLLL